MKLLLISLFARQRAVAVFLLALPAMLPAQPTVARMEFDVASVKENRSGTGQYSNFPLGPGDGYNANGGHFSTRALPLATYIRFAYRMSNHEANTLRDSLPGWTLEERYDIEARTDKPNVTKDEMRLMMQSLLADRVKLVFHRATEEASVYGLELVKPDKLGPKLRRHPGGDANCLIPGQGIGGPLAGAGKDGFLLVCGGLEEAIASAPGRRALGFSNVSLKYIAEQLEAMGRLERPVVDATGLTGNYDFVVEFVPERPPNAAGLDDADGPTFREALAEQTGLKLVAEKSALEKIVIDHIQRPSAN
jgi:uncharacterized protein (TIGR03435 family)